jgi:hypothetical protein
LPGLNVTTLLNLFGRIQSVQQFVNILSQGGVPGLEKMVKQMDKFSNSTLASQRAQDALRQNGLKILNNAFQNISLSLVRSLNMPLSQFGHVVARASDEIARHRTTTTAVEAAGATAILLRLLGRTATFGPVVSKIPLLGRLAGAGGKAAASAIMAEETGNVIAGGQADGSRANPFWVIISPYSWAFGTGGLGQPIGGGGKGGKTVKTAEQIAKDATSAGGAASIASRLGLVGVGAAALPAAITIGGGYEAIKHGGTSTAKQIQDAKKRNDYMLDLLRKRQAAERSQKIAVSGKAHVEITAQLVDKNGNEVGIMQKKGVQIDLTKDTAPQAQGRAGVRKGQ